MTRTVAYGTACFASLCNAGVKGRLALEVRLRGETWDARCDEGADRGDEVVVTAQERLRLVVTRSLPAA